LAAALAFVFAAALALAPTFAAAHGATPQKVVETIEIAAPPEKVWAVIGDFADVSWRPEIERVEAEGGNLPEKATRRLYYKRGGSLDERLVQYDGATMSLRYIIERADINVLPVGNLSATLTVRSAKYPATSAPGVCKPKRSLAGIPWTKPGLTSVSIVTATTSAAIVVNT